jgi:PmbA protein
LHGDNVSIQFEKGDLKLAQVEEGTSVGLRVVIDGRTGFAATNQSDEEALTRIAQDAVTVAKLSPPDEANDLPGARPLGQPTATLTDSVARFTIEDALDLGSALVEAVLSRDPRVSLDRASCDVSRQAVAVTSTEGVAAQATDGQVSLGLFGMAVEGEDVGGFDYTHELRRETDDLRGTVDTLAARFCEAVLGNLNAGAGETYQGPVLFTPEAFAQIFLSPLTSAASAIAVQRGRSALGNKLGESVAASCLNVWDDPTDPALAGAAHFDREGQPCGRMALVSEGILSTFLYNGYAARVEGRESTGHALGGARGVPGLGPHAAVVDGGDGGDLAAMTAALDRGLYIQRFSGSVDPASGDFSGVAKSARWVEGGAAVRPVREVLLAGNVFDLLHKILSLSSDNPVVMGSLRAPWALVDGVSVTAG